MSIQVENQLKYLAQEFNLTEEDRKELLPSGTQASF